MRSFWLRATFGEFITSIRGAAVPRDLRSQNGYQCRAVHGSPICCGMDGSWVPASTADKPWAMLLVLNT